MIEAEIISSADHGKYKNSSDIELIELVCKSSKEAMAEIIRRYYQLILKFCYRQLRKKSDAEDVAQETFIKVWLKTSQLTKNKSKGEINFQAWIYRIAYHLCIDLTRKNKAHVQFVDNNLLLEEKSLEVELERTQVALLVNNALFSIPERQRSAIFLCKYQGLSNREAADIMDVSVDALESLLSRGRRKLSSILIQKHKLENEHDG